MESLDGHAEQPRVRQTPICTCQSHPLRLYTMLLALLGLSKESLVSGSTNDKQPPHFFMFIVDDLGCKYTSRLFWLPV